MLDAIRKSWGWTGLKPVEIVSTNSFGNLIVRAADGAYWRICPEELYCKPVARNSEEYESLSASDDFRLDWQMTRLVKIAKDCLGTLDPDHCYCLKVPAVLGGAYEPANFGTVTRRELIAFSGRVAEQVKGVPDGTQVTLNVAE